MKRALVCGAGGFIGGRVEQRGKGAGERRGRGAGADEEDGIAKPLETPTL